MQYTIAKHFFSMVEFFPHHLIYKKHKQSEGPSSGVPDSSYHISGRVVVEKR